MSMFQEHLAALIKESGVPVAKLAAQAKVERTAIQKAIKGERLLNAESIARICDTLCASLAVKDALVQHAYMEKIGPKKYYTRQKIQSILEKLSERQAVPSLQLPLAEQVQPLPLADGTLLQGQYQVEAFLQRVIAAWVAEKQPIQIYLPITHSFVFSMLQAYYLQCNGALAIAHLVELDNTAQQYQTNLTYLEAILPFSFSQYGGYQARYLFAPIQGGAVVNAPVVFPFYLMTQAGLVLLSADGKQAVYYNNAPMLGVYQTHFTALYQQAVPFSANHATTVDALVGCVQQMSQIGGRRYTLEAQPCFAKFFTLEIIEAHLRQEVPNRAALKQELYTLYASFRDVTQRSVSFSTIEGLRLFAQTGICVNLPPQYAKPFSPAVRKELLLQLKEDLLCNEKMYFKILNREKFRFNLQYEVQASYQDGVLFLKATDDQVNMCYLQTPVFCECFYDFMEYLYQSDLVYSKSETLEILADCIAELDALCHANGNEKQ